VRWKWKLTRLLLPDENITAPLPREEKAVADLAAKLGLISDNSVCGKSVFPGCGAAQLQLFVCSEQAVYSSERERYKFATQKLPPAFLLSATFIGSRSFHRSNTHSQRENVWFWHLLPHLVSAAKVWPLREKPSRKHAAARNSFFLMSFFPRHFSQSVSARANCFRRKREARARAILISGQNSNSPRSAQRRPPARHSLLVQIPSGASRDLAQVSYDAWRTRPCKRIRAAAPRILFRPNVYI
jgi:hypothetical protein